MAYSEISNPKRSSRVRGRREARPGGFGELSGYGPPPAEMLETRRGIANAKQLSRTIAVMRD
jgi:hypothetical protein